MNRKLCQELRKKQKWTKDCCQLCSYATRCKEKDSNGSGGGNEHQAKEGINNHTMSDQFKQIPIKEILVTSQTRKSIDPARLKELTESIKRVGILEPLIVREDKDHKTMPYHLVAGERRLRAAIETGLKEVPCIVKELSDSQTVEIQVIENLQREDLNPIDEANGYKALLERCNYDTKGIASKIGKSESAVRQRIRLLELPKKYQDAILEEKITPGHGLVLIRLQDSNDQEELFKEILNNGYSVREAESNLRSYGRYLKDAPFNKDDCKQCPHNGQQQKDLFEKDRYLNERCLNPDCFDKKMDSYINQKRAQLKKQGFNVITQKDLEQKGRFGTEQLYDWNKKSLGENYKNKCRGGCEHYVYVIFPSGSETVREICLNARCFRALTRSKDVTGSPSTGKQMEKIWQAQKDFYIEKISSENNEKVVAEKIVIRLILSDLLMPNHWDMADAKSFLSQHGQLSPKEDELDQYEFIPKFMEKLLNLSDQAIEEAIVKIVLQSLSRRNNDILDIIARYLEYNIAKDFVITEKYLQAKTKEQIVGIAKEIGLTGYLQQTKSVKPDALLNKPKPQLIKYFFAEGFDLAGKVPKEILVDE